MFLVGKLSRKQCNFVINFDCNVPQHNIKLYCKWIANNYYALTCLITKHTKIDTVHRFIIILCLNQHGCQSNFVIKVKIKFRNKIVRYSIHSSLFDYNMHINVNKCYRPANINNINFIITLPFNNISYTNQKIFFDILIYFISCFCVTCYCESHKNGHG